MKNAILVGLLAVILIIAGFLTLFEYSKTKIGLSPPESSDENPTLNSKISTQEKSIKVKINEQGYSEERILWSIKLDAKFSIIPKSEWGMYIPKNSEEIEVRDNYGIIVYKIEPINDNYYRLIFKNSENIYFFSDYFFNISYKLNNNPLIFEPYYFYEGYFKRFETDDKFSISIELPENSNVIYSSLDPEKEERDVLHYTLDKKEEKKLRLQFEVPGIGLSPTEISSKHYSIKIPSRYASFYGEILEDADKAVNIIEDLYGFQSPYKWNIEIININDIDFEERTEAFYLGEGRIRVKADNLQKTREEILYTLVHETVHGFNSIIFKEEAPNFWWEEGSAEYVSYYALETLGYKEINSKDKNIQLVFNCFNIEKSFISEWSPNKYLNNAKEIHCEDISTNYIDLGYAQSFYIVNDLAEKYSNNIFSEFYAATETNNIEFSSKNYELNKQMNSLLSEAANKDLAQELESYGVRFTREESPLDNILTGKTIDADKPIDLKKAALFALAVIILLILMIKKKRNKKKLPKKKT